MDKPDILTAIDAALENADPGRIMAIAESRILEQVSAFLGDCANWQRIPYAGAVISRSNAQIGQTGWMVRTRKV